MSVQLDSKSIDRREVTRADSNDVEQGVAAAEPVHKIDAQIDALVALCVRRANDQLYIQKCALVALVCIATLCVVRSHTAPRVQYEKQGDSANAFPDIVKQTGFVEPPVVTAAVYSTYHTTDSDVRAIMKRGICIPGAICTEPPALPKIPPKDNRNFFQKNKKRLIATSSSGTTGGGGAFFARHKKMIILIVFLVTCAAIGILWGAIGEDKLESDDE